MFGKNISLPIGQPWSAGLWPGSTGNVSQGGTFFQLSKYVLPYPINSINTFIGGNRKRTTYKKTKRKRATYKKANRKHFKKSTSTRRTK